MNYYQCHYLYFGVRISISYSSSGDLAGGRPGDQKNAVRLGVRERRELLSAARERVLAFKLGGLRVQINVLARYGLARTI